MSRIQTNTAANTAYRNLSMTSSSLEKSIQKLSSGFRINRAADDAAGLSIANRLRLDGRALQQASRNASQAGSVLQIADGAVSTISDILGRMKELAVQSASDNVTASDRQKIDAEFQSLRAEIDRTVDNTKYQGATLLDGNFGVTDSGTGTLKGVLGGVAVSNIKLSGVAASTTLTVSQPTGTTVTLTKGVGAGQVTQTVAASAAAGTTQTLTFDTLGVSFTVTGTLGAADIDTKTIISSATASASFQVGSEASSDNQISIALSNLKVAGLALTAGASDLLTNANANTMLTNINNAIDTVNSTIGTIGAAQSRLEFTQSTLSSRVQNVQAAESIIRDADMAYEMTQFTKTQILQQAGTAMLAQANQSAQGVLTLLRG